MLVQGNEGLVEDLIAVISTQEMKVLRYVYLFSVSFSLINA